MKPTIVSDFSKQTDDEFGTSVDNIIESMTDNPNYPLPIPTLATIIALLASFRKAVVAALSGGPKFTAAKNRERKALAEAISTLGHYVQVNCKNDLSILLGSGFPSKKESESKGILPKPQNFKVEAGPFSGSLEVSLETIDGAHAYIFMITEVPVTDQSQWKTFFGKRKRIIRDLIPGRQYALKAAAKGAADEEVYSDIIQHFVA